MNAELERFFASMRPFLLGQHDVSEVERALGPSASGSAALAYYRTLIDRNHHKILGDIFDSVRAACLAADDGAWSRLVRDYVALRPRATHDPNDFGGEFPAFVAEYDEWPEAPTCLGERVAELADYHWCLHRCGVAADGEQGDDGVNRRLFVRQYSFDVPAARRRIPRGELRIDDASLERDTFVVIFRHLHTRHVEVLRASLPQLRVVAGRAGVTPVAEGPGFAAATEALVELGVLYG